MSIFQADTVFTPVMPSFRGYLGALQKGTQEPSKQAGAAAGDVFAKSFATKAQNGSAGVEQLQKRIAKATTAAAADVKAAREKEDQATRQLNIAELKLEEVRGKANASAAQVAVAEDRVAKGKVALRRASNQVAAATSKQTDVQDAANRELKQAERAADQAGGKYRELAREVKAAGAATTVAAREGFGSIKPVAAGGIIALTGLATAAVGVGIKTASGMETARIGFTTMLGSAEKADKFLRELSDFAAKTPFEFPELQEAASSLISVGVNADDVIPIMRTLGDATAGMGTGSEGIQRATVALQQMSAAGRITGEDLNQLRDAGIPVFDLLAAATGKSKTEVAGLAQAGKLGRREMEQLFEALRTGKGLERFNGLMEKTSTTLTGLASTLSDTFSQKMAQAVEPSIPLIKDELGGAINFVSDSMPAVSQGIGDIAKGVGALSPLVNGLASVTGGVLLPAVSGVARIIGGTFLGSTQSATFAVGALITILAARKASGFADQLVDIGAKMEDMGGAAGRAGSKVGGFGIGLGRVSSFLGGPWGIAIGLGITAIVSFATQQSRAAAEAKKFTDSLDFQNGKLTENSRVTLANKLAKDGVLDSAVKAGISEKQFADALIDGGPARQALISQLDGITKAHTSYQRAGYTTGLQVDKTGEAAKKAADALRSQGAALDQSSRQSGQAAAATQKVTASTNELKDAKYQLKTAEDTLAKATQKIIDKFTILRDGALDQASADNAWRTSLLDLTDSVKQNGKSLAENTTKGIANRNSIIGNVQALNDKITADFKATEKSKGLAAAQKVASSELTTGRKRLLDAAEAAGFNRKTVASMIDTMLKTPKQIKTDTSAPGAKDTQDQIDTLQRKIQALKDKKVSVTGDVKFSYKKLTSKQLVSIAQANLGYDIGGKRDGGRLRGPGTGTSDSLLLRGSTGEFMMKEKSAKSIGYDRLDYMNQTGQIPGYRDGGVIGRKINVNSNFSLAGLSGLDAAMRNATSATQGAAQAFADAAARLTAGGAIRALAASGGGPLQVGQFPHLNVSDPHGRTSFRGHTFTNLFVATLKAAERQSGRQHQIFQGGFRPATSYSGTSHAGDAIDAKVDKRLLLADRQHGVAIWDRTGKGNWISHMHGVPLPGAGYAGGSGVAQAQDWLRGGDGLGGRDNGPRSGTAASGAASAVAGGGGTNRQIGRRMMLADGYGAGQWPPLNKLWTRESGWNEHARNASSGAYGIPQALPGSKMASAGANWRNDPKVQIDWGLGYIRGRYGSPASAWSHSQRYGWYDGGGNIPPGLTVALNGTGKNEVAFTAQQQDLLRDAIAARANTAGPSRFFQFDVNNVDARQLADEMRLLEAQQDALHPIW